MVPVSQSGIRDPRSRSRVGCRRPNASFTYDNLGNRTGVTRGNGVSTAYGFDAISRLTSLAHTGTSSNQSYAFTYDPAGEIVSKTTTNPAYTWNAAAPLSQAYQLNGQNQYTSVGATAYAYDTRGNLAVGAETYNYDSENRLIYASLPAATLSYYPDGALYQTMGSAATRFLYDDDQIVAEYDGSNNLLRRYVEGPAIDEMLVWYEGTGTSARNWLLGDHEGSVIAGTDQSGVVQFFNSYDEYGQPGTSNVGRFQYTGQAWIPEASLYDYRARDYMPSIGRFLQTDPKGYDAGTLNLYGYVGEDPIDRMDPSGLTPIDTSKMSGSDRALGDAINKVMTSGGTQTVTTKGGLSVTISATKSGVTMTFSQSVMGVKVASFSITGTPRMLKGAEGYALDDAKVSGAKASYPKGQPQTPGTVSVGPAHYNIGTDKKPVYDTEIGVKFQNTTTLSVGPASKTYDGGSTYGLGVE